MISDFGTIGMCIGYDMMFPETPRALALAVRWKRGVESNLNEQEHSGEYVSYAK